MSTFKGNIVKETKSLGEMKKRRNRGDCVLQVKVNTFRRRKTQKLQLYSAMAKEGDNC